MPASETAGSQGPGENEPGQGWQRDDEERQAEYEAEFKRT
jgi:hypothetical protein